jgi:putative endonuclease
MPKGGYVYIMTNKPFGRLYIGVTANLPERIFSHREGRGSDHCRKFNLHRLVYMEPYNTIEEAIAREKAMKKWLRVWKLRLISEANPEWADLYERLNA